MGRTGFKWWLVAVAVAVVCSCKDKPKDTTETIASVEQTVVEVDTMVLRLQKFQKQLVCNGRLSAVRKAELQCPGQGVVLQSVKVANGQHVAQGDLLCVADTRDREAELKKAGQDLERSKVELQDKLIGLGYDGDLGNVPEEVLHRAEITSGYYSAKHQLAASRKALADCELHAPFPGRIANLEGRMYQKGEKFCTLIDDSSFDVEFRILEAELSFIRKGQTVRVTPFVNEEESYEGFVKEINPVVDEKGLVRICARVRNVSDRLMDGMNVRVIVEREVPDMFVVPKDAVVERDGYNVVFMYNPQTRRAVWTYVDILHSNLNSHALSGCESKKTEIHEGDIVITSGNLNLADDTEVKVVNDEKE